MRSRAIRLGLAAIAVMSSLLLPVGAGDEEEGGLSDLTEEQAIEVRRQTLLAIYQGRSGRLSEEQMAAIRGTGSDAPGSSTPAERRGSAGGTVPDPDMPVLHFEPLTTSVSEGEEFETAVTLSNPRARAFDRITLTVLHNSSAIEPLGYTLTPLSELAAVRDIGGDPAGGQLRCEFIFHTPREDLRAPIVRLRWRARREVRSTPILFLTEGAGETFVGLEGGRSILGNPERRFTGLINATVRVHPSLQTLLTEAFEGVALPGMEELSAAEEMWGGVELMLVPRTASVRVGETLDVDVVIYNATGLPADEVAVRVDFDPEVLEVLDTHDDNWIEMGTNIWDGGYHALYPFDMHLDNRANNGNGTIDYRMGFTEETPLPSGVVATIRFRALALADDLPLTFDPERTSINFLGEELLGDPDEAGSGLIGVHIDVRRPSMARRRLAAASEAP